MKCRFWSQHYDDTVKPINNGTCGESRNCGKLHHLLFWPHCEYQKEMKFSICVHYRFYCIKRIETDQLMIISIEYISISKRIMCLRSMGIGNTKIKKNWFLESCLCRFVRRRFDTKPVFRYQQTTKFHFWKISSRKKIDSYFYSHAFKCCVSAR